MTRPSTASAWTSTACGGSGSSTSSQAPAETRADLLGGVPSTSTAPASTRSAALLRDSPNSRLSATSTRSPANPSGTGRARLSGIGSLVLRRRLGWLLALQAHAFQGEQDDQHPGTDDRPV